jgi:IS1 family transposase
MQVCPQGQRARRVNSGAAAGQPQQRCRPWGAQLTRPIPRGTPRVMTVDAVRLSLRGLAMPRLACRRRGSAPSGRNWRRPCAQEHEAKPEPPSSAILLARDALWHDRTPQRRTRWRWQALARDPGPLLAWACGRRHQAPLQPRVERQLPWEVKGDGPDHWATSAAVIPQDARAQSPALTHALEPQHGRQRPGCGRFPRTSRMVSQSQAMGDLPRALCAKCGVHGHQDERLSRLD